MWVSIKQRWNKYVLTLFWQNLAAKTKHAFSVTQSRKDSKHFALSYSSCRPSLSGVWMWRGCGCLPNKCCPYRLRRGGVFMTFLYSWNSPTATDSWMGTSWRVAMWTLSLLSSQNNWWWPTRWPFNPPLLSQSSRVTIWPQIFVQAVWAGAVCYSLCFIRVLLADLYCHQTVFLTY